MSGHIPQEFITTLIQKIDLVDLINARVPLRKHGRSYIACCPFHQEKTPSFHVRRDKQFYYCFGCHASGNAINFLMEFDRSSFIEAIEELATITGDEVPYENTSIKRKANHTTTQEKNADYALLEKIAEFYHQQLFHHSQKQIAVEYLKKRGLTKKIVEQFQIGFAPPGWETLAKQFHNVPVEKLITLGMLIEKEKAESSVQTKICYDRFRQRIMFPIRDRRGHVIAFGGRVLSDQDTPKYLNSPETPLFTKGKELYGLYEMLKAHPHVDELIVVEGYMDVISLTQHGVTNAVATLGTSLTEQNVQQLFHFSEKILFCFDGDNAGKEAAWRALEQCLPLMQDGRQANFLFLPDKEDPDSFVRKYGANTFYKHAKTAIPLSRFLIAHLAKQVDLTSLDGKASLLSLARPLLAKIPKGMLKELIIDKMAQKIQLPPNRVHQLLEQTKTSAENFTPSKTLPNTTPTLLQQRLSPAKKAISLLLQNPQLASTLEKWPLEMSESKVKEIEVLVELISIARCLPDSSAGTLLMHWDGSPLKAALGQLAIYEHLLPSELWAQEFSDCVKKLNAETLQRNKEKLFTAVAQKEWIDVDNELRDTLREFLSESEE